MQNARLDPGHSLYIHINNIKILKENLIRKQYNHFLSCLMAIYISYVKSHKTTMKQFPRSITLPTNDNILAFDVYQRGDINAQPSFKEEVIVPTGKRDFDLYRTLAYECRHIPNSLYRENVTVEIKNRTRPIRLDAILIIDTKVYLMDTIVKASDIPKVKRYGKTILSSVSEITNILVLISKSLTMKINLSSWLIKPYLIEIGE